MRTKLFWTGPLGCGGAIGTGTATTFCWGVFARPGAPGSLGGSCPSPGPLGCGSCCGRPPLGCCCAGSCPNDVDPTSKRIEMKIEKPFMPESLQDETM